MNRGLARSVIELLRDDVIPHKRHFDRYTERHWRSTKRWLDMSGVALYLLRKLKEAGAESCLPPPILAELEQNATDRRVEVQQRYQEFARLLQAFQQQGIRFVVEKGFALFPEYCPDMALRFQMDFDFMVDANDVEQAHKLVESLGYRYIPTIEGERRFSKGDTHVPTMDEFYKPKSQHIVELHFDRSRAPRMLELATQVSYESVTFSVLQPADLFVEHVLHFVKHFRGGWARTDALLEYRSLVNSRLHDRQFWGRVTDRCEASSSVQFALSMTAILANSVLGTPIVEELRPLVASVPAGIRLWILRYGRDVLTSEFPGNKLHLILERECLADPAGWWVTCIRRLIPLPTLVRVVVQSDRLSYEKQAKRDWWSLFILRVGYHVRELFRMCYVLTKWNLDNWKRNPEEEVLRNP